MSIFKDQSSSEGFQLSNLQNEPITPADLHCDFEMDNPNQRYYSRKRIDSEEIECVLPETREVCKKESDFELSIESKQYRIPVWGEMVGGIVRPMHLINSFEVNL